MLTAQCTCYRLLGEFISSLITCRVQLILSPKCIYINIHVAEFCEKWFEALQFWINYCTFLLHPGRGVEYCDQFVCLSVCLCLVCVSVCLRAYFWNHWTDLHETLFADPLWPWLSPLVALRYVMYFQFCWRCHVWPWWAVWWLATLRHRAEFHVYECFVWNVFCLPVLV